MSNDCHTASPKGLKAWASLLLATAPKLRAQVDCAADTWKQDQDSLAEKRGLVRDLTTTLENRNAQSAVLRAALIVMIDSHGLHGPCSNNGCSECRRAYTMAVDALKRR